MDDPRSSRVVVESSMTDVLIVTAHADDAELMLGGAIAGWSQAGFGVTVAVVATSEPTPEGQQSRRSAAERASVILGHELLWLAGPGLMQVEDLSQYELVSRVDALLETVQPSIVISHVESDSHFDHQLCASAVLASSRRYPVSLYAFGVSEIRTPRHAGFDPTLWIDIAETCALKYEALRAYDYEGKGFRRLDIDAVMAADRYRGLCIGASAAESLRQIRAVAPGGELPTRGRPYSM